MSTNERADADNWHNRQDINISLKATKSADELIKILELFLIKNAMACCDEQMVSCVF